MATQLGPHELPGEDAVTAHQRSNLFAVLRSATFRDDTEQVYFGELHLFAGPIVLTVRHSDPLDLAAARHRVEGEPHLLQLSPRRCCAPSAHNRPAAGGLSMQSFIASTTWVHDECEDQRLLSGLRTIR